jgi:hypothetical protein
MSTIRRASLWLFTIIVAVQVAGISAALAWPPVPYSCRAVFQLVPVLVQHQAGVFVMCPTAVYYRPAEGTIKSLIVSIL